MFPFRPGNKKISQVMVSKSVCLKTLHFHKPALIQMMNAKKSVGEKIPDKCLLVRENHKLASK